MRRTPIPAESLDDIDRLVLNRLQDGFPISEHPFTEAGAAMGMSSEDLIGRIKKLRELGVITRFGPFFDAEALGGEFCLCAMSVPEADFERVMTLVNAHDEVAHNYEREHWLNMWFVLACETTSQTEVVARKIEKETGVKVLRFPKLKEYFIGFRVNA